MVLDNFTAPIECPRCKWHGELNLGQVRARFVRCGCCRRRIFIDGGQILADINQICEALDRVIREGRAEQGQAGA
jgi:hypothetical protein